MLNIAPCIVNYMGLYQTNSNIQTIKKHVCGKYIYIYIYNAHIYNREYNKPQLEIGIYHTQ